MNINKDILLSKLDDCIENRISIVDLLKWATDVFHYILKYEIMYFEKVTWYFFLSDIMSINKYDKRDYINSYLWDVKRTITGEIDSYDGFIMSIPESFRIIDSQFQHCIHKLLEGTPLGRHETAYLHKVLCESPYNPNTINEYIFGKIVNLLRLAYNFDPEENKLLFDIGHCVYVDIYKLTEEKYLSHITRLLRCLEGNEFFHVGISFISGSSKIEITF